MKASDFNSQVVVSTQNKIAPPAPTSIVDFDHARMEKAVQRKMAKEKKQQEAFKSQKVDPWDISGRNVYQENRVKFNRMLRNLSHNAPLINTLISYIINSTVRFLQPESAKGLRGFRLVLKDSTATMNDKATKQADRYMDFLLNCQFENALYNEDNLVTYAKKILRDNLTLDQTATELLRSNGGDLLSFEAVDAGGILRYKNALCPKCGVKESLLQINGEEYKCDDCGEVFVPYKFVQMIQEQEWTKYTAEEMIYMCDNPRTDIYFAGYGYSKTEQSLKQIISMINTFNYNAAAFTDDHLPRGLLLIDGDMDFDAVQEMQDYIIDVMSPQGFGGVANKYGIPMIPAGGKESSIKWQPLAQNNKDMEYSHWDNMLIAKTCAVYGVLPAAIGIPVDNAPKMIDSGSQQTVRYSDDKGIGNALMFLQRHLQAILDQVDSKKTGLKGSDFRIQFIGYEDGDGEAQQKATKASLETTKSVNELRVANDEEPYGDEKDEKNPYNWPGVGNPQIANAVSQYFGQQGGEGEGEEDPDSEWDTPEDGPEEINEPDPMDEELDDISKSKPDRAIII